MKKTTRYTNKQAAADKKLREQYKALTLPYDRLKFMSEAEIGAIYLCNIHSEAEDMDGGWYPMLGGFQLAKGDEKFKSDTYENALAVAQGFKEEYGRKFAAYKVECAELV